MNRAEVRPLRARRFWKVHARFFYWCNFFYFEKCCILAQVFLVNQGLKERDGKAS